MVREARLRWGLVLGGAALVVGCGGASDSDEPPQVRVLSSPPHLVGGNDALIEVALPASTSTAGPVIQVNGRDVSGWFQRRSAEDPRLIGLVNNLREGANEITVRHGGGEARLSVTAWPLNGAMISGPQEKPYACTYAAYNLPAGRPPLQGTGEPDCSVVTRVDWFYRSTTRNAFVPLPSAAPGGAYPDDLARLTVGGVSDVPYVVRVETGTVNRAIYQSAILHDPLAEPAPSPWKRPRHWNGKLFYPLGGGCTGGWYTQGGSAEKVLDDLYLARGFAVTTSTLNVMGNNCNDLLSSETTVRVKEKFIETFGPPLYTVAIGGSGGAYQAHQTGDNYPGLFDGIVVAQVFPDVTSATLFKLFDSRLLSAYFARHPGYSADQKRAISGFLEPGNIDAMSGQARRIDPVASFPAAILPGVGPEFRYDPATNPRGARATVYDHTRNVYGVDADGVALRPIDNRGVQYGLKALNEGAISAEEFIALNRDIGGLDRDLRPQAARTVGDLPAIERAYRSGRIVHGGGGLAAMPIIDLRDYNDAAAAGEIHNRIHSFSMRERLQRANGHLDNHVMLSAAGTYDLPIPAVLDQMDRWMTGIALDATPGRSAIDKVRAHRPADLVDACWIDGVRHVEPQVAFGSGRCNARYPTGLTPRMVAGGPVADDVVQCELKPLDRADYRVSLTQEQWTALHAVFPEGVCDWSRPGRGQAASLPWQSFGPSTVNQLFDILRP